MDELLTMLSVAEAEELQKARAKYGHDFNSPHEAYGVLVEEIFEAKCEYEWMKRNLDYIEYQLHANDLFKQRKCYENIEKYALKMAAELIQVAAMCRKAIESPCMTGIWEEAERNGNKSTREAHSEEACKKRNCKFGYDCPNCGTWAGTILFDKFCDKCGQAIDSEEIK